MTEEKDNVVSLSEFKKKNEVSVRDTMVEQLSNVKDNISCGIILILNTDSTVSSGFFNTSFQDEAVLKEVLNQDVFLRQQTRVMMEQEKKGEE